MSNLEASRILASALKDVDEILKVSGCESNDICDAYDNLNNQYTLPEKSVQNVRRESYSKNIDNSTACDETYLYKTEKEFFTLMNRLHKCIEKLHSSQNIALLHTSEYCASNFKVTGNSHINVVEPSITQPTEYNLINNKQSVQLQQRQPHYMASSNDYENLNDKLLHQRIIRLQAQIQAQANRIAELEKDKTSLSHLVNRANRTGQNDIMNQFTIDMDNLQLLSEVSKQHLRITSLEEMNRDLEEKINKLEKELSHRSDLFDVRNSYKDSQSLKYNRQYANQHPMMSSRSATLGNNNNNTNHTLNDESSKQMILQNRLHYPAAFRRSITPVAFNNRNSFIATSNPYEYNSNFIYQSSLSGTQSTPPTSRLINDQLYTNNTFLQNERIHPQRLLIPGENYFLLNADQFRSASLNELRYSKSIQSNTVTNKVCNPNVKNGFIVKSPADSFNVNTSIDCSRIFNSRNLLPPQYGSSYHQKIYTDSSRARSPPPQHLQTYHQKNNSIDDRQSLADCKLNECASSLSPSTATLGSPSSGKFTTGQTTQSKASPSSSSSSSEYQHFTEITNQLGNLMKDNKAPTLSKSTTINNNGKNHFKKLNIEHENFLSWDKNMISAWLYKIGLGYTVTHTRKWLTSGQDLVNESKKSLAQLMGIRNPLHLKKLLIHIRLCMKDNCPASNNTTIDINNHDGYFYRNVEPPENFDMSGWLNDLGLSQYIPQFDKCIIDPYVLDQLTMEDLSMLKISNELHMLSLRWGLQMLRHINFDRSRLCRDQMEQCSANIPLKRNILHSSIPSENENHSHTSLMNTTLKTDSMNIKTNSNSSIYSPIQICYWTQKRVVNWLQSIELPEYASELCGNGVHGALIILEDRFTPDLLADILRIPPVKSLVRRHLTQKFIELVGLKIWQRKQHSEVSNNLLTLHSKIKLTKKKSIFHSTRGSKSNLHHHDDDNDISNELVCPNEINTNHISIFAEEVVTPNQECIHETGNIPTILLNPIATNVQKLELQETDL
ncbi:hypothetical protein MN116_005473 [Schistosoma mekongi]|uniref:SAM domain-containing protein n=1 Tax=Schistosoma mekongi TaxID=38744 RepID=A0AAE2D5M2_SCHME|nr:hypothetical protein MN116_005473 [Schistosoma mekongi]